MAEATTKSTKLSKDDLGQKYGQHGGALSLNTVRQTLMACGLDTSKRYYSSDDEDRFKAARRFLDEEGKTYRDVAEHFKVNLEDAGSGSGDAFFENQATEASDSGDVSFELANAIASNQAAQVADMVPALTMYHLNQMMNGGAVHTKLQQLVSRVQGMGGNSHEIMMQGIQRVEEQKALASGNGSSTKKVSAKTSKQLASAESKTTESKASTTSTTAKTTGTKTTGAKTTTTSTTPSSAAKSSSTSTASSATKSTDTAKK